MPASVVYAIMGIVEYGVLNDDARDGWKLDREGLNNVE
jgi:hypothetical protein